MMVHQTAEKLRAMRQVAMAAEYIRQSELPSMSALDFDERIGMISDAEWLSRDNSRIKRLTKEANLRYSAACFADIDYRPSRKLDRAYIARLTDFAWVKEARNIILTGSTGTGKTWLACAFGVQACRISLRVRFYRVNRLLSEMAVAAGTGCADKFLDKLKKCDLLILDDWGLASLTLLEGRFLHEVFEERCGEKSTIISAQLPVSEWHSLFEDKTVADAVLDRIVNNSHRLGLQGPSMRLSANRDIANPGGDGGHDACSL
jgi:DNA replication protein DnaC